jgi:uncharacterized protein (DUF1810 family)
MSDSFDLRRFVDAQAAVYRQVVVDELSHGRKQTHWMWFTFPQISLRSSQHTAPTASLPAALTQKSSQTDNPRLHEG